ncbi:hypothetical protein HGRIS_008603 [Hohenbuehelia grisea]|uniref:Uncharacterized protein n=1 Tax=Hohenbuehelia grisea TaxID=104357 RepID=A0ABR3J8N1_9AGAR
MSDALTYARQLLGKLHGYPLWVPEPYGHSVIYRTKGVRIGDVGYITQDGAFETLFNIRAPPDHPINRRGVPENFEQVEISHDDIVFLKNFHGKNSAVTSLSAQQRSLGIAGSTTDNPLIPAGAGAGFEYSWSTSSGAILHLPQGGSRLSAPDDLFREQALKHATKWYKFVLRSLRRRISNGSLYLIKVDSWMVGAFSDSSSDSQVAIQLGLAGMAEGQASYNYTWSSSSPPIYRVGPDNESVPIEAVDVDALEFDDDLFSIDAPGGRNQSVFVRGYRISLNRSVMSQILGGSVQVQVSSIEDSKPGEIARSRTDSLV